ncbi:MAG: PHP domain-containing protein [Desulfobacteraceae bacterium]|nr:PHP domain-containing protein [Desulfobacteraceae bacterium]
MTIYADLHNHTTASDGDFTPDELVFKAKELEINTIGITDHDTLKGLGNAVAAGQNYGIEVIPGVEVSIRFKRSFFTGTLHLLCYFSVDLLKNKDFRKSFSEILSKGRGDGLVQTRVDEINRIFGPVGETPVLVEELLFEDISKYSSNVTRRHFALALEEIHNISNKSQINKIIGNKSPAYVPSGVELEDIKGILKDYPVLSVLAHPAAGSFEGKGHYKEVLPPFETVEELLPEFLDIGLKGLEVYYPGHSEEYIEILLELADKHNLIVTGGSDCHDKKARPFGQSGISKKDFNKFKTMLDNIVITEKIPDIS